MPKDHPTSSNRLFNVLYFNRKSTIYLYIVVGSSVTLTVNKLQATPVIHSLVITGRKSNHRMKANIEYFIRFKKLTVLNIASLIIGVMYMIKGLCLYKGNNGFQLL